MAKELKEGDIYLSVSILGSISVAAFKNEKKEKPTDPDYIGNGIAIWKNKKKKKDELKEEDI